MVLNPLNYTQTVHFLMHLPPKTFVSSPRQEPAHCEHHTQGRALRYPSVPLSLCPKAKAAAGYTRWTGLLFHPSSSSNANGGTQAHERLQCFSTAVVERFSGTDSGDPDQPGVSIGNQPVARCQLPG